MEKKKKNNSGEQNKAIKNFVLICFTKNKNNINLSVSQSSSIPWKELQKDNADYVQITSLIKYSIKQSDKYLRRSQHGALE